jgi:ribosomal protein S19
MTRLKFEQSENDVKKLVKKWYDAHGAWSYAPIQTGMGEHGIPDRVGCVPVKITPEMVGMTVGVFVAVEAKKPGRRGEERAGMTPAQRNQATEINQAHGIGQLADGIADLHNLDTIMLEYGRGNNIAGEVFKGRIGEHG